MNGRVPANLIDANGRRLINLFPLPNADPAFTDGYNYVQNIPLNQNMHQWLTRFDVNVSTNTRLFARYNLQAEEQNFRGSSRSEASQPRGRVSTAPADNHRLTNDRSAQHLTGGTSPYVFRHIRICTFWHIPALSYLQD